MAEPIKAMILGIDTLLSTDGINREAWRRTARLLDLELGEEELRRLDRGNTEAGMDYLLLELVGDLEKERRERLIRYKKELYWEGLKQLGPEDVKEETISALVRLRNIGLRLAVYSWNDTARLLLHQSGLASCFDAVLLGKSLAPTAGEALLSAPHALALPPADCLYITSKASFLGDAAGTGIRTAFLGWPEPGLKTDYRLDRLEDAIELAAGAEIVA
jgi:beta-phosphoglucomutase-like phosphatase (HAD superfamily)